MGSKEAVAEHARLSQKEFLTLYLLHTLSIRNNYPKAIHEELQRSFKGKIHSYDYLCKICRKLDEFGHIKLYMNAGKNYYKITEKGTEMFKWYQDNFFQRFYEVKLVFDRFMFDLSGSGTNPPVTKEMPEEYRAYFSKLVSVKDLVRYTTLKMAMKRKTIYIGEVADLLKMKFGWIASNGYLYDLSHEMEEGGLLVGRWESEKRTKRYLRITDEGKHHYKQIADSATYQVQEIQKYLAAVLSFLEEK